MVTNAMEFFLNVSQIAETVSCNFSGNEMVSEYWAKLQIALYIFQTFIFETAINQTG